jgi:hypothetical protein
MFVPAMPAAKAKSAAPHVPMVGAGGAVLVVLMSMPMHQKSSLLDIIGSARCERSMIYRK